MSIFPNSYKGSNIIVLKRDSMGTTNYFASWYIDTNLKPVILIDEPVKEAVESGLYKFNDFKKITLEHEYQEAFLALKILRNKGVTNKELKEFYTGYKAIKKDLLDQAGGEAHQIIVSKWKKVSDYYKLYDKIYDKIYRHKTYKFNKNGKYIMSIRQIIAKLKEAADQLRLDRLIVYDDDQFEQLTPEQQDQWQGYAYKMTYGIVTPESAEEGDYDDQGWEVEGSEPFESLESVLSTSDIQYKNWLEWSSSDPDPSRDWLTSEEEQDMYDGSSKTYDLWIYRVDGLPLSEEEFNYINKNLGVRV